MSVERDGERVCLSRYRVTLEALEPLDLPAYLGSTLRGAFGQAFRRLACPARGDEPCPLPETCPWPYLVFGQWTHVGKGATIGLGQYRLDAHREG